MKYCHNVRNNLNNINYNNITINYYSINSFHLSSRADNDKNNNYLKLFKYLIFEDVNNEEKHSIPFSNRNIENLIKKLLISSRVPVTKVPATKATASKTQKSVPVQRAPKTIGSKKPIPVVVPVAKSAPAPVPTHGRSTRAQTKAQTQAKK